MATQSNILTSVSFLQRPPKVVVVVVVVVVLVYVMSLDYLLLSSEHGGTQTRRQHRITGIPTLRLLSEVSFWLGGKTMEILLQYVENYR